MVAFPTHESRRRRMLPDQLLGRQEFLDHAKPLYTRAPTKPFVEAILRLPGPQSAVRPPALVAARKKEKKIARRKKTTTLLSHPFGRYSMRFLFFL